jgi:DNA invertase Pin-like site-specific DNA recombinase
MSRQSCFAYPITNPFEAILIWKFSRFARNREDAIIYKSLLRKHGVSVISINEQVDDSPAGRLLEGIIEVIDEFYSSNLAQDTIRGMKENAARGFHNGTIPIGYKAKEVPDGHNQRKKLEPDEAYAPLIRQIFKMSLEDIGIKEIAKTLNEEGSRTKQGKPWSKTNISYILKNEVYTGTLVWGGKRRGENGAVKAEDAIRIEKNHPALVDRTTFDTIQKLLARRTPKITHPRRVNSEYLLSSLIFCGKCGSRMIGSSAKSGKFAYYACQNYAKRGKSVCDMKLINRNDIEKFVVERIKSNILTEENLIELFNIVQDEYIKQKSRANEQIESINQQLKKWRARLEKLYDTLETGKLNVDDLAPRIRSLKQRIDDLERKRNEILESIDNPDALLFDMETIKYYVRDLMDLLKAGTIVEQRSFLRSFIQRITVNLPTITIDYTIPINKKIAEPPYMEVLPIVQNGSPGVTLSATSYLYG